MILDFLSNNNLLSPMGKYIRNAMWYINVAYIKMNMNIYASKILLIQ